MIDICDENIIAMYHITADDRVMGSVSGAKKLLQTVQNSTYTTKEEEEINRIYVSLICPNSEKVIDSSSYIAQLVEASGGMVYTAAYKTEPVMMTLFSADSVSEKKEKSEIEAIAENLKSILGIGSGNQYQILTHTGDVGFIALDKHLTAESDTDTDCDGLSDWEEVDTGFIAKYMEYEYGYSELSVPDSGYKISNEDLPTISYVLQYYDWKSYMKNVPVKLMRFASQTHVYYAIRLLPIISDPTRTDSDGDGNNDYDEVKKFFTSPLISNPLIFEKYNYDENGILNKGGKFSLLWCISDDYFIDRDFLSETEVVNILAKRGIKEEQAKILYEKCYTFIHEPNILFNDNAMYHRTTNDNMSKWVKANEFDKRIGINPAIILSTWKWEAGYGQGNYFGSLGGTNATFEEQLTTCIARCLRFYYFSQYSEMLEGEKVGLRMNVNVEEFYLTPCNAAMY